MPWLMKAEPDSRIVKGKDVKFSIDDLEAMGESPWDGVRNHEAKKIMKEKMKLGDKVLFYHSNTKTPGVFGIAEISKEGYPDYTAWDESHPYYHPKSTEENPVWFMVSVRFVSRLEHPVTLSFIKSLVGLSSPPAGVEYIGKDGLKAVQSMTLVNRGRLSVQPVEQDAFDAIVQLGSKGGFEAVQPKRKAEDGVEGMPKKAKPDAAPAKQSKKAKNEETGGKPAQKSSKATKITKPAPEPAEGTRRSSRIRK